MFITRIIGFQFLLWILLLKQSIVHANLPQTNHAQNQKLNTGEQHSQQQVLQQQSALHQSMLQNSGEESADPYHLLNELKQEQRLPYNPLPWNPYAPPQPYVTPMAQSVFNSFTPFSTSKFLPFFGYSQPIFIPYPFLVTSDLFYATSYDFSANDGEENMSRAANPKRPMPMRNSPIYYMRLPPTPYMFVPPSTTSTFASQNSFPPMVPPLPSFSGFSSVLNLPINFLANGKPTNIYRVPSTPPLSNTMFNNQFRPTGTNYLPHHPFSISPAPQRESNLTPLKRTFIFNGRPEEIYILQNNYAQGYY